MRVGYLTRPGRVADVVAAARLSTVLWGGRFNPIIPVGEDLESARKMIRDFRVDVLHPIVDDPQFGAVINEHEHLAWPLGTDSLLEPRGPDHRIEPTIVDVLPALDDAARRGAPRGSRFRFFNWAPDDPLADLLTVWLGQYDGDLGAGYANAYERSLRAHRVEARDADFGGDPLLGPLTVTGAELRGDYFGRGVAVVAGDPQSADDLAAFWNLRAAGYRVLFYAGDEHFDRGLERDVRLHIARYPQLPEWRRHVDVFVIAGDDIPAPLRELLGPDASPLFHRGHDAGWSREEPPALFSTDSHTQLASAEDGGDGLPVVHLALERKPFSEAQLDIVSQEWIVDIGLSAEASYEGTLRLPYLPQLNRFYAQTTLRMLDVRADFDRLGVLTAASDEALALRPLPTADVISNIFKLAGLDVAQSPSGLRAHQIIRQLGHLQRCRVFRIPGVRNLLRQREAHMGLTFPRAAQYVAEGFATARPFYVDGRHLDDPGEVFRFLLQRRVFLAAHELTCPNCDLASLHPARELDDEIRCPQCGHVFLLAPAIREKQWRFRLTGLLAQPEQHVLPEDRAQRSPEAVAVLLTLVWLHDATMDTLDLVDANFTVHGEGIDGEIDVVAVERTRRGRTGVVVGECRTENRFSEEDVAKYEAIAATVRRAGIDCYPLFATLREAFSQEELTLFRSLRDRERYDEFIVSRPPILLAKADIERGDFAEGDRVPAGTNLGDLSGLAAASNAIYLG